MCLNQDELNGIDDCFIKEMLDREENQGYLKSYPHLIKATKLLLAKMKKEAILPIAYMCYGWMQRIPVIHDCFDEQKQLIFKCKDIKSKPKPITKAIEILEQFECSSINNSWVGLSKVLHFINPHVFPILDSRIAGLCPDWKTYNQKAWRKTYLKYICFVHKNLHHKFIKRVQDRLKKSFGYKVSKVRALELVLFELGRRQEQG